ncbi:cytochrome P450 [Musa troglodytarum]|uniref:Cytochrome P450 n=1 Tax=Musa troglodytarum TaxID=320322 RepID=A0A9E7K1U3_9LILI|nr:cytochrome P450 [Musa troglodytarum]
MIRLGKQLEEKSRELNYSYLTAPPSRSSSLAPTHLPRLKTLSFWTSVSPLPFLQIPLPFPPLKLRLLAPAMSYSEVDASSLTLFLPRAAISPILAVTLIAFSVLWFFPGGIAWALSRAHACSIPGPSGFVSALSGSAAHRVLAGLANSHKAIDLMAFSVGFTRFVVSSHPDSAKEILQSSAFADRPIKESACELLFHRAMGFAPFGEYWRNLRRISSTHLFSPRRVTAFGERRRAIGEQMVADVRDLMAKNGAVEVKKVLHVGSLNNVMMNVFGRRYDFGKGEGSELEGLVKEGYELLGLFNWADHLPLLGWLDLQGVRKRCRSLSKRVNAFVGRIIDDHRVMGRISGGVVDGAGDFVDVLLGLEKEEKLSDADMVAVLWAIVKESLRMHPPGPLLSWARLAVHDAHVGSHFIPAGTTAMVNMWAITHDESIWAEPNEFRPERFTEEDVNILGSDLRLAPFGAGRRVCPGKAMGLATVHLWLAQLLQSFDWVPADGGVDLSERLRMSLEMEKPLVCRAVPRC